MKIAVIGSGIGGLTSALLLEKQGHEVTIFEQQSQPGGRIAFARGGGFQIDKGPTIVLLPEMLQNVIQECDLPPLDLIRCDPLYDIHFHDGSVFTKFSDREKQRTELNRLFPGEAAHYERFMSKMETVYQTGVRAFLEKEFSKRSAFFTKSNIQFLWKSKAYQSVQRYISQFFSNERLQQAYSLQSLYIGGSPNRTPAIYGLISYSEHAHGIWYLKGGYGRLIDILAEHCHKRNITIMTDTKITSVLTENSRVTGISTDEDSFSFDTVIYNGDYPKIRELLKLPPEKKQPLPSSGCLLIYLGTNKRWEHLKAHQFLLPADFDKNMQDVFENRKLPDDPSVYVFNPAAIDPFAAPHGKAALYLLVPVPSGSQIDWQEEKERVAEKVLNKVEKRLIPNLSASIEWKEIRTPQEAAAEGMYEGGSFGIAPVLRQSGGFRPQNKPFAIEGLYAVGASVHPGGGVPIVMQGALNLAELIKNEVNPYVTLN